MVNEVGAQYTVDLAIPQAGGWLPVTLGERPGPAGGLRFPPRICFKQDGPLVGEEAQKSL